MNQLLDVDFPENHESTCLAHTEVERFRRSILVVEDESFVREVTREILLAAGYRVFAATNAIEAVQTYEQHRSEIDLVITDLVLPGETGRSLAVRLQRQNPGLRVLIMSGYQGQLGFEAVPDRDFLVKPFSSNMLLDRVRLRLDCPTVLGDSGETFTQACGVE